uniref:hypothetical protein n=1 Tax=Rheinheimera sp. TaxID=1869214 RepID=UPI0040476A32
MLYSHDVLLGWAEKDFDLPLERGNEYSVGRSSGPSVMHSVVSLISLSGTDNGLLNLIGTGCTNDYPTRV